MLLLTSLLGLQALSLYAALELEPPLSPPLKLLLLLLLLPTAPASPSHAALTLRTRLDTSRHAVRCSEECAGQACIAPLSKVHKPAAPSLRRALLQPLHSAFTASRAASWVSREPGLERSTAHRASQAPASHSACCNSVYVNVRMCAVMDSAQCCFVHCQTQVLHSQRLQHHSFCERNHDAASWCLSVLAYNTAAS
jgi:hypothetical protein